MRAESVPPPYGVGHAEASAASPTERAQRAQPGERSESNGESAANDVLLD